jgi:hypothetical protein
MQLPASGVFSCASGCGLPSLTGQRTQGISPYRSMMMAPASLQLAALSVQTRTTFSGPISSMYRINTCKDVVAA